MTLINPIYSVLTIVYLTRPSMIFFLRKIILPESWVRDSRRLKPNRRKLGVDTQNWLDNMGRTGQTSPLNRSDRSRQVCQIANWTAPLRRSRRDDRNAYIERLIRSPDEGVMPPRRPAPRSDRSDQSKAVRPVQTPVRPVRNAQSELGVVF